MRLLTLNLKCFIIVMIYGVSCIKAELDSNILTAIDEKNLDACHILVGKKFTLTKNARGIFSILVKPEDQDGVIKELSEYRELSSIRRRQCEFLNEHRGQIMAKNGVIAIISGSATAASAYVLSDILSSGSQNLGTLPPTLAAIMVIAKMVGLPIVTAGALIVGGLGVYGLSKTTVPFIEAYKSDQMCQKAYEIEHFFTNIQVKNGRANKAYSMQPMPWSSYRL